MTIEEGSREWLDRSGKDPYRLVIDAESIITALLDEVERLREENSELAQRTWDNDSVSKRLDNATRAAYERVLELVDDVDEVTVSGYYAQLGDAAATKRNIIAAIRKEMEGS